MSSTIRIGRTLRPAPSILRRATGHAGQRHPPYMMGGILRSRPTATAPFHSTPRRPNGRGKESEAELDKLDLLGGTPAPSHSVDICMADGFKLNNGATIEDGSGAILVGGEAFAWRPWLARGGSGSREKRLLNSKGQWEVPDESLGLFDLVWPRPGGFCSLRYTKKTYCLRRRRAWGKGSGGWAHTH